MDRDKLQYVAGGAALGAVVGALAGLVFLRRQQGSLDVGSQSALVQMDRGKLMRLGLAVLALVRQIAEM